ncbi:pyridoxamine 5'-phosphate oxidase family protein [Pseudoflavonifractor capillosus]|uniref:pyridoxamine 5'-phosphate oxidase family protein n=1 Tax=Pseudoflavonifractor capillosus TaxID=106588 RepID=UPI00195AEC10|nr:pyridoxamine 5'-phosphate oxidase family protein [Pseudoflavonifractor capillosus]MBM6680703.1 pyridoxamine 5'-phosphate oxidase family protein [Pseudoflavonifractor capillosus]
MNEVVKFLNENPVQYLATVGRDGKAKCRPFMFAGEKDGKLWFCTNSTKEVYKDMQANPDVEISVSSPTYAWIRLSGKAVFENNILHGGHPARRCRRIEREGICYADALLLAPPTRL